MLDKNITHDHVPLKSTHDPTRCWTSTTTCSSSLKSRCPPILLANRWHIGTDALTKTKTYKGTICKHNKNKNKEITKTGNQQKRREINIKVSS